MGRWEPNAQGRLEEAALALYEERGFERATVAEIAREAGLTERTFFRHFADKREVLFSGAAALHEALVEAVAAAPAAAPPLDAAAAGLYAAAAMFDGRKAFARRRQAVIAANTELMERELAKLASLAAAVAAALRARGVQEPAASLVGELAIAVLKVAFERWTEAKDDRGLAEFMRGSLAQMKAVTAGP